MMKTIVFVPCSKTKDELSKTKPVKAKDLYNGPFFKKAYECAESLNPDKIFILSAEHGLVEPEQDLSYYDKYMSSMSKKERCEWSKKVIDQLKKRNDVNFGNDKFIFLTGKDYYTNLLDALGKNNCEIIGEGLKIGEKLQKFNCIISSSKLIKTTTIINNHK